MTKFATLPLVLWISLLSFAQASSTKIAQVGGHPESARQWGDFIYASNLGHDSNPSADGDGYISKLNLDGKVISKNFLPLPGDGRLDFPMGIQIISDVLYVVDLKRVVGYSMETQKQVFEAEVPDAQVSYLNDIVYVGDDRFVVSATNVRKLYSINSQTHQWSELAADQKFGYVNGLTLDSRTQTLFVVHNASQSPADQNGRLSAFKLSGSKTQLLWTITFGRFLDGVSVLGNGRILVSDWNGVGVDGLLHIVNGRDGSYIRSMPIAAKGLADIEYAPESDTLVSPALLEGTIHLISGLFKGSNEISCTSEYSSWSLSMMLDEFDIPRELRLEGQRCEVHLKVTSGSDLSYYDVSPNDCGLHSSLRITDFEIDDWDLSKVITVEVTGDKDQAVCDSPHPQDCDPSVQFYSSFKCRY